MACHLIEDDLPKEEGGPPPWAEDLIPGLEAFLARHAEYSRVCLELGIEP